MPECEALGELDGPRLEALPNVVVREGREDDLDHRETALCQAGLVVSGRPYRSVTGSAGSRVSSGGWHRTSSPHVAINAGGGRREAGSAASYRRHPCRRGRERQILAGFGEAWEGAAPGLFLRRTEEAKRGISESTALAQWARRPPYVD